MRRESADNSPDISAITVDCDCLCGIEPSVGTAAVPDFEKPVLVDVGDNEADLVDVCFEHNGRLSVVPVTDKSGDTAESVGCCIGSVLRKQGSCSFTGSVFRTGNAVCGTELFKYFVHIISFRLKTNSILLINVCSSTAKRLHSAA